LPSTPTPKCGTITEGEKAGIIGLFRPRTRGEEGAMFAIKAAVDDLSARTYDFRAQKTMYGGKRIGVGDTIFIFASENEGGPGLIATGVVIGAMATTNRAKNALRHGFMVTIPRVACHRHRPRSAGRYQKGTRRASSGYPVQIRSVYVNVPWVATSLAAATIPPIAAR
jgi:hypothetical protein